MDKYYTKPCNFYFGKNSISKIQKKKSLPLNGNRLVSFDSIEIISRKGSKTLGIPDVKLLPKKVKYKVQQDLKKITQKKKFKNLKLSSLPVLMGIINLTPDSFSDGGKYKNTKSAYEHSKFLIQKGCQIIDVGGESTKPGSSDINVDLEWKRIQNFLKKSRGLKSLISVDTRKSKIMYKANKYKLNLVNDISGLSYDSNTLEFLKKTNKPFVLNHIKGEPVNMQKNPKYKNVVLDIYDFFEEKLKIIRNKGIKHNNIILDPGIGFGKNLKHNITILKDISVFHSLGFPLLLGISRKRFIKDLSDMNDSKERIGGTISASLWSMMLGVQLLRVHDVNEVNQAIKVFKKLNF